MVCELHIDKVIFFLIAEEEEESRGCFFGLTDVSGRVPQKTDTEVEICGQSQHL